MKRRTAILAFGLLGMTAGGTLAAPEEVSLWILSIDQEERIVIANPEKLSPVYSSVAFARPTMVPGRDRKKTIIITGVPSKELELVDNQHLYLKVEEDGTGQWTDLNGGTHTVRQYKFIGISRESDRGPKP